MQGFVSSIALGFLLIMSKYLVELFTTTKKQLIASALVSLCIVLWLAIAFLKISDFHEIEIVFVLAHSPFIPLAQYL